MDPDLSLRHHLRSLLTVRQAHCAFEDAVANVSLECRGKRPEKLPYSVWELVEHLRRAQHDILVYCEDREYETPDWPDEYWPDATAPPDETAWADSVEQVQSDRDEMVDLVMDDTIDLYDTVPSSTEHTYLREALLLADHAAYHVGQIVTVRRCLDDWPQDEEA